MEALKSKVAVGLAVASFGGAMEAAPADAYQSHGSSAPTHWANVGGFPFINGGIHSRQEYVNAITSNEGAHLMQVMGLNAAERKAWRAAARRGEERSCGVNTGQHFDVMGFGAGAYSVDGNNTLTDSRYRNQKLTGYCLDVKVPSKDVHHKSGSGRKATGETLHTFVASKCGNFAVKSVSYKFAAPKHKAKLAEVSVFKHALDANDEKLFPTPTHTFEFMMRCVQKGHLIQREVIYNSYPQPLGKCDVGKPVTVKEMPTLGPEQWETLSDAEQTKIVKKNPKRNLFVFKDREKKVTPPPAQCTDTMTPEQCFPKDGTQGPGAGTPGTTNTGSTVGGPGAGGSAGNETYSVPCYDAPDSQNGDLNPATEGEIMYVASTANVDQNQYCIGQAQPATNP
jgi:hypothetical protein